MTAGDKTFSDKYKVTWYFNDAVRQHERAVTTISRCSEASAAVRVWRDVLVEGVRRRDVLLRDVLQQPHSVVRRRLRREGRGRAARRAGRG